MTALNYLLAAPDLFALFGLNRTFDVDLALLDLRYTELKRQVEAMTTTDAPKAGLVLESLATGHRTLTDPIARGGYLLDLIGGASEPETAGLPPGEGEKLEALRSDPAGAKAERDAMVARASNLFRLTGSADNGVVQRARRRQIRETLNAIRKLDELTSH